MIDPVSTSIATVENAIKALRWTLARVDDWNKVVPEANSLIVECDRFYVTIQDLLTKEELPIHDELTSAHNTIKSTHILVERFIRDDTRADRSIFSNAGWRIQRVYLAYFHRATFKATTAQLVKHKEEFIKILKYTEVMDKPTAYWFKSSMVNEECFKFWKTIGGQDLNASSWTQFAATYQREYNDDEEWDGDLAERIRRVACSGNGQGDTRLSIAGFISLTNKCGFPLNYNELPQLLDSQTTTVSAQTRMEVARLINDLITYYSTDEMRDLLVAIFTWYQGCKKEEREEYAMEWARTVKANRGKPADQLTEREKLAEKVDKARRTYSFFFQRYMVVFKIGQLSKEMFKEVDFPGKARMFEFINNVGPLDKANFHVVIGGKHEEWASKEPKVYKFLKEYIDDEKREKEARRQKEQAKLKKEAKLKEEQEKQLQLQNGTRDLNGGDAPPKRQILNGDILGNISMAIDVGEVAVKYLDIK